MPDFDAIIIGGGPAGLTAGLYLCRGGWRTLLIEKEVVGGYIMNIELIENYPGFTDGVAGAQLGMEMKNQAQKYGLQTERNEVIMVQLTTGDKMVSCANGIVYTTSAIMIAGGAVPKKLGVPGENMLSGSGVFYCAFCDGGQYADRVVAVCGGGDSGASGALYLAKIASKVIIIEAMPELTATAVLRDSIKENPKIEVRCGVKVNAILGEKQVEGVEIEEKGKKSRLKVDGVLVHIGMDPNTDYLEDVVALDKQGRVAVNERMETEVPGIFAAGDIRSDSPGQVAAAVGDGAAAAISAQQYLQKLK
ncbi:MAG: FAD-dependent oxidoreductase [Dehalococcoidales bacterium]|nr:FAD-dependent oxidoreductase [Dehalococcoidales bacterium]